MPVAFESADVLVIGSGSGGLSAALCAAKQGARVLVLEAAPHPGGYLNPFKRKGFEFDTGLHYLGELEEGAALRNLFERLDLWNDLEFLSLGDQGCDRFVVGDMEFETACGEQAMVESLSSLFPDERRGIERYFRTAVTTHDVFIDPTRPIVEGPRILKGMAKHPWLIPLLMMPFSRVLDRCAQSEPLRTFLAGYHGCYGLPPSRAAALVSLFVQFHSLNGSYYPRGGSRSLRDALLNSLKAHGGELLTRTKVTNLRQEPDGFQVEAEGHRFQARSVISTIEPRLLYGELLDPKQVPFADKSRAMHSETSFGSIFAFIGTDLDLTSFDLPRSNLVIHDQPGVDEVYTPLFEGRVPDEPGMVVITSSTLKDPDGGHAPKGHHTLELIAMAPFQPFARWSKEPSRRRSAEYNAFKERLGMAMIRKAERYIPGLSSHLVHVEFATPATNLSWVGAQGGGCYGPASTPEQSGVFRFPIRSHLPGLFLAGSSTLGPGIFTTLASGEAAAAEALDWLASHSSE